MTATPTVDLAGPPPGTRTCVPIGTLLRAAALALLLALSSLVATRATAQESTPEASPTPQVTPAPDAPRLELELQELNDSGISGTVTLYAAGDRTIVEVEARDTGENHPSHIHAGRCDDLTPEPAYTLENVGEEGRATSVIDVSLQELLEGEFSFDMHLAPNELGTLIACAEIEGEPTLPEGVTPPATPTTAPPTETPTAAVTPVGTPTATTPAGGGATETPAPTTPPATEEATPVQAEATEISDGTGGAINENQNAASLPLFTQGASGVTGTAVLTSQDDQTLITILLSGEAVTGGHIAHLHDGTCAAPGDYTLDLNPVGADGVSETPVDIPFTSLLTDGYFINVHESEANWDTWLVCGELTNATVGVVVPEVAPETGGGVRPTPTPAPREVAVTTPAPSDGTAGLSGKGVPVGGDTTLPQRAGIGTSLPWPQDPLTAVIWASAIGAVVLGACAWWIRRGERHASHNPTRWTRLGI